MAVIPLGWLTAATSTAMVISPPPLPSSQSRPWATYVHVGAATEHRTVQLLLKTLHEQCERTSITFADTFSFGHSTAEQQYSVDETSIS